MKSHLKKLASPLLLLVLGYVGVALMIWYTSNHTALEPEQPVVEEELILLQPKAEYLTPEVPVASKTPIPLAQRRSNRETVAGVTRAQLPEVPVASKTPIPLPQRRSNRETVAGVTRVPLPEVKLAQDTVKTLMAQAPVAKSVTEKDSSIQSVAMVADSIKLEIGKTEAAPAAPGRTTDLHLSMDQEKIYDDILIMLRQKLASAQVKEADRIPPATGEVVLAANSNMMPVLGVRPAAAGFKRHGIRLTAARLNSLVNPANGGLGGKIGYSFRDNAKISMNVDLGIMPLVLNKSRLSMVTGDVYGQLHFRNSRRLQPTLSLGFGSNRLQAGAFAKPQIVGSVCAGGGMDYKLSDTISLNTSVQYRQLLNEIKVASGAPRDGFVSLQVGLSILFGGTRESAISIDNSLMADNK